MFATTAAAAAAALRFFLLLFCVFVVYISSVWFAFVVHRSHLHTGRNAKQTNDNENDDNGDDDDDGGDGGSVGGEGGRGQWQWLACTAACSLKILFRLFCAL